MRNPRRTAITASALVIGLALVGLTATFGASARASVGRETGVGLRADYLVKTDGFSGFSTDVAARLRDQPGVTTVVPMRFADAAVDGDTKTVASMDPASLEKVVDLGFVSGGPSGLDEGGVLIADDLARHLGVDTGDQVAVQFSQGQLPLTVRGVYRRQNFIGLFGQSVPLLVSPGTLDGTSGGSAQHSLVLLRTEGGEDAADAAGAVTRARHRFPEHLGAHRAMNSATTSRSRSTSSSPCSSRSWRCRRSSPSSAS